MRTSKREDTNPKVRITRVRLTNCRYGDEVRTYFRLGKRKSWVDIRLAEFSEAALKGAKITEKLALIFSHERAMSLVGMTYSFDEVIRDGSRFNEGKRRSWGGSSRDRLHKVRGAHPLAKRAFRMCWCYILVKQENGQLSVAARPGRLVGPTDAPETFEK